jgi:hypothetical protein
MSRSTAILRETSFAEEPTLRLIGLQNVRWYSCHENVPRWLIVLRIGQWFESFLSQPPATVSSVIDSSSPRVRLLMKEHVDLDFAGNVPPLPKAIDSAYGLIHCYWKEEYHFTRYLLKIF